MNRGNLKNFFLASCAGLKPSTLPSELLDNLCQLSADDVAFRTLCLETNDTFNATEDDGEYDLSEIVDEFICLAPSGVWFNNGTVSVPEWKQLRPVTVKWLDENRSNWRTASSDTPQYFYQEGDILGINPAPSATLANGFKIYFYQGAFPMTTDNHFPFRGTSQIARLSILDRAMSLHFRWQAQGMLEKKDDYRLNERAYENEIVRVKGLLMRNPAIQTSRYTKLGDRPIGRGNFIS